jgi:spermidine synthase
MNGRAWFSESIAPGVQMTYEAREVVARARTERQELVLIDNEQFGQVLMLDGIVQTTSADEFVYHEMLSHVPLLAHGHAEEVLIVGGGDCGLAEEVLKHRRVRRLTQVEIDPAVVEFSKQHLAAINGPVFSDRRFDLRTGDGREFVETTEQRFDVILVDSTDPIGAACTLFTREFYSAALRRLRAGGVLVVQAGVPFVQSNEFQTTMRNLAHAAPIVTCYLIASPSYVGGHMALGWASDSLHPADIELHVLEKRFGESALQTRYYTPEVHKAAFALPPYISALFGQSGSQSSAP